MVCKFFLFPYMVVTMSINLIQKFEMENKDKYVQESIEFPFTCSLELNYYILVRILNDG